MMRGFPLTGSEAGRWNSVVSGLRPGALLPHLAVGLLAGLIMSQAHLHLGLPGHKILVWATPVVAARLLWPCPVGAIVGTASAAWATLVWGGSFAGGALFLPLVVMAGGLIDATAALARRRRLAAWQAVPLLGLGTMLASLFCLSKRLLVPSHNHHMLFGIPDPLASVLSYAFFGLLAGAGGALAALALIRARRAFGATPKPRGSRSTEQRQSM